MGTPWSIRGLALAWGILLLAVYQFVLEPQLRGVVPEWVPIVALGILWIAGGIALQLWDLGRFNRMARDLGLERIPEEEAHLELSPRAHRGTYAGHTVMLDLRLPESTDYPRSRFFAKAPATAELPRIVVQRVGASGTGGKDLPPAVDLQDGGLAKGLRVHCQDPGLARQATTTGFWQAMERAEHMIEIDLVGGWLRGEVHDRVLDLETARTCLDAVVALARGLDQAAGPR